MKTSPPLLTLDDVAAAQARISGGIRRTVCRRMADQPELAGMEIWLKREDLQRTRSFKERGALNALLSLGAEQRLRGIVAASAGNHALGLAYQGSRLGVATTVVMPLGAPAVKVGRCRGLGAEVLLHGANFDAAQEHAAGLAAETGRALVHPFDDRAVIAGQGTLGLEIVDALPDFDAIVLPVGGGGLLAGVATAIKACRPKVRVIAVQTEGTPALSAALAGGGPAIVKTGRTLADGLAVARVGEITFAIASQFVDQVVTVSEADIAAAISLLARNGIVAEGAGATALAAVLGGEVRGRKVVVPITGGNIDPRFHERAVADAAASRRPVSRAA